MGRVWLCLLSLVAWVAATSPILLTDAATRSQAPPGGLVLVHLRRGRDGMPGTTGTEVIQRWRRERALPVQWVAEIPGIAVQLVRVPVGRERELVAALCMEPEVLYAEPDYRVQATGQATGPIFPNDPSYGQQWNLTRIRAPEAWAVTTGSASIVMAIVDSGIWLAHPDLGDRLWSNPREVAGNGRDDDGNGKVDDVHGWHFYHAWSGGGFVPAENADVADENGHGTHVAGIAAAATNNGVGVAGISWQSRVMVLKVLDRDGSGWYSDVAAGIIYAADQGARVINLSLGGEEPSETMCAAIEYARGRGCLVVAATGNKGGAVLYPAACPAALAVGASDRDDRRASFSSYGTSIDLLAPGVEIYSTWYNAPGYRTLAGTSMAAAHVSGVAALVASRWSDMVPDEIVFQITHTATDSELPGWDLFSGWGRLDAAAAVAVRFSPSGERILFPLTISNRP